MSQPFRQLRSRLSVDSWAVLLGLVLALAVRLGILKTVSW